MFSWQRQTYPVASQISNKLSRREMQDFLSYAPWSEFKKLNLSQVVLLKKNVCFMSQRKTGARDWNCANRDLFRRKYQILKEMQMREKGVIPSTKKEESLFTIISQKVCNFFKASTSDKRHEITESNEEGSAIEKSLLQYNQRQYQSFKGDDSIKKQLDSPSFEK